MPQLLQFSKDVNGACAYAPDFPDYTIRANIPAGTAKNFTIPSSANAWIIAFLYPSSPAAWVAVGNTASAPSTEDFEETDSIQNPAQLTVYADQEISVYNNSADALPLSVIFYAKS